MRACRPWLAAAAVAWVAAAGCASGTDGRAGAPPSTDPSTPPATSPAAPSPAPSPSAAAPDASALESPEAAAAAGADALLRLSTDVGSGPWRDLAVPAWSELERRPVYVAAVTLTDDRRAVAADVVIATEAPEPGELVLRLLPAATALGSMGVDGARVSVDGRPVEAEVDRDGARLVVPLGERGAEPLLLRIRIDYRVPDLEDIADDGGPAAFGVLARTADTTTLGHWLPVLTLPGEDGPMVGWGDVGGFPVALWSVVIRSDATVLTGGADGPCPVAGPDCTWARGLALRDVSAVAVGQHTVAAASAGPHSVRAFAPGEVGGADAVAEETAAATGVLAGHFGPLAWHEIDTVAVPFGAGAAGMEFPGLALIDRDHWTDLGGGFGTYIITHEVGHQWFHALLGSGSLSDPVVDESLSQYASYLYFREALGTAAAQRLADRFFRGRYAAAVEAGLAPAAPARPLAAFDGDDAYGPLVYGRGPLAWLRAEEAVGADRVIAFVDGLVEEHGLRAVSDEQVLAAARAFDPALAEVIERVWFDPAHLDPASA